MNERDSEQVAVGLKSRGYELVDSENSADIVLLNTPVFVNRQNKKL